MTKNEIKALRSQLKIANQRLVALEKANLETTSAAYRYVSSDMPRRDKLTETSASGHLKFKTALKGMSDTELQELNKRVRGFLATKTSTQTGAKNFINKTTQALNKRIKKSGKNQDIELDKDDVSNFWKKVQGYIKSSLLSSNQALDIASDYEFDDVERILNNIDPEDIDDHVALMEILNKQEELNEIEGQFVQQSKEEFIEAIKRFGIKEAEELIEQLKRGE